jgi:hypothetical protein
MIAEDFGCMSTAARSKAYVLVCLAPTLALSVATLVYGSMYRCIHISSESLPLTRNRLAIALYHLSSNHRINIKILTPHLRSRDAALCGTQYYRLMIMSMVLGIWGVVWTSLEI